MKYTKMVVSVRAKSNSGREKEGFTLIELLVGVAILSVMVALAAFYFTSSHHELVGAADNIKFFLQSARVRAINTNKQHMVVVDIGSNNLSMQMGNNRSGSTSWTTISESYTLPNKVTIGKVTYSGGTATSGTVNFIFNPDSTCSTGGIYIQNDQGEKYKIMLTTSTARVSLSAGW